MAVKDEDMYLIKYFDSLTYYDKNKDDVIALDFPKNKNNFMFKIKVEKDKLETIPEDEFGENAGKLKLDIIDGTKNIFSKFLTEVFGDKEAEIYGLFDGEKYYIVDIRFNTKWFVQEDIDELGKKYGFNVLKTLYKGKLDEEKIKPFNRTVLIKSRLEEDFFTSVSSKERYVIFWEMKNGK